MITKRVIPCLDVKDGRVVKGVNFKDLSDVSSPVELGRYYSDAGWFFMILPLPAMGGGFLPIFSKKSPRRFSSP